MYYCLEHFCNTNSRKKCLANIKFNSTLYLLQNNCFLNVLNSNWLKIFIYSIIYNNIIIHYAEFDRMKSTKFPTLAKTDGDPEHEELPQETIPCNTLLTTRGPPESPCS